MVDGNPLRWQREPTQMEEANPHRWRRHKEALGLRNGEGQWGPAGWGCDVLALAGLMH